MQEEQAAALLTGPSDVSGGSSQALLDVEKEQLLARIQQLEAAGHQDSEDEDERHRYPMCLFCLCSIGSRKHARQSNT